MPERIALEVHGFHVHTRTRYTYQRGLERVNDLQRDGWIVLQHTPQQLLARPWGIARMIEDVLRTRG